MKLTIIDAKSHEPLLILGEDDQGMNVLGGDPRMIDALGLKQMSNLKEIADFINSHESDVQAVFDHEEEQEEAGPDMDSRIKPALEMIRALMQKVNDRKRREKINEESAKPEHKIANTSDSEILMNPNDQIYVSVDGDNIGNAIARAEEMDDEETLSDVSNRINAGQDMMKEWAIRMGGYVVEQGGDEAVMKVPATSMGDIENMRELYKQVVGATCSVGVGKKISESTKARMLAKLKGKNRVLVYDSGTPQELELRLQDKDTPEANKLRNAMRPEADQNPERTQALRPDTSQAPIEGSPQEEQQVTETPPHPEYNGQALSQSKLAEVQQKEKKPLQKEEKEEQPKGTKAVGAIDHDMLKKAIALDGRPQTGSKWGDPSIDDREIDDTDEHEERYVRNAMYLAKHGDRIK